MYGLAIEKIISSIMKRMSDKPERTMNLLITLGPFVDPSSGPIL
jgi:hypothetical protein